MAEKKTRRLLTSRKASRRRKKPLRQAERRKPLKASSLLSTSPFGDCGNYTDCGNGVFIYGFLTAKTAAMGDVVSVDYTGYFSDGALFDTTIAADAKGDLFHRTRWPIKLHCWRKASVRGVGRRLSE